MGKALIIKGTNFENSISKKIKEFNPRNPDSIDLEYFKIDLTSLENIYPQRGKSFQNYGSPIQTILLEPLIKTKITFSGFTHADAAMLFDISESHKQELLDFSKSSEQRALTTISDVIEYNLTGKEETVVVQNKYFVLSYPLRITKIQYEYI